jgi:anaerobic magnesium-protoporphyrin IX monomethyl ester cyclase
MRITFLGLGTEQLGISQLSAILKKNGHETNVAFAAQLFNDRFNLQFPSIAKYFDDTKDAIQTIKDTNPDVVAFGALTSTFQWGLEVCRAAKAFNPNIKVIFGGVHPSAVPDLVLSKPEVDFVVVGEGDVAFPIILEQIQKNDYQTPIINTRYKTPEGNIVQGKQGGFIQDLDSLPIPDKTIWEDYVRIGDIYLIMATRGCPYRCSFCFNNFFAKLPEDKETAGKYVRLRSVEHVINELKQAKSRYNIKIVDFQDDVFGTQKKWLREFCERYKKEINLPFQILTHPKFMDEETGRLLSDAGCKWIQMGVQSMDEDFKKESLLRYEKSDDIENALKIMHKYRMKVKVDHMFGLPNEPISAQENALKLYANNHIQRIQTFWTCFLPGTQLMNEAIIDGTLNQLQIVDVNEGRDFYFFRNLDNIKDKNLQNLYHAYEFIFKIMPILPFFIARKIKPSNVIWIPNFLKSIISFFGDIFIGLMSINPEFFAYLYHNLFHLYRFIGKKIGIKNIKAIKN